MGEVYRATDLVPEQALKFLPQSLPAMRTSIVSLPFDYGRATSV